MAYETTALVQTFATLGAWDDFGPPTPVKGDEEVDPCSVDPRKPTPEALSLDERIAALEAELASVKLEKARLLGSQALITRLPSEILSRIFELGVHDDLHLLPALHLVSSYWRRTALHTPLLWTYLKLDDTWGYGHAAAFVQHTEMILQRSGTERLYINLDFRYVDSLAELEQLMVLLAPHLGRCFVFRASVPDWEWLDGVKKYSDLLGPSLEEFYLRLEPSDAEDVNPVAFLSPTNSYPYLRRITLEHAPLYTIRAAHFPALHTFYFTRDQRYHASARMGVTLKDLLSFLSSHPSIVSLRVQGVRFQLDANESVFAPDPVPTRVPALRELTLVHLEATGVSTLLSATSMPLLQRLALYMDYSDETDLGFLAGIMPTAHAALARFPALTELDLRNVNVDGSALFPFVRTLRVLSRLQALGVCNPPNYAVSQKLFELLARPHDGLALPTTTTPLPGGAPTPISSNWLLPELRALSFGNCRDISGHEIMRVLRARNGDPTPVIGTDGSREDASLGSVNPTVAAILGSSTRPEDKVERIRLVRLIQCYSVDEQMIESIKGQVESFAYWN